MLEPKPGSHEVRGSIPLGSTKSNREIQRVAQAARFLVLELLTSHIWFESN
jgi:hypothetical protein